MTPGAGTGHTDSLSPASSLVSWGRTPAGPPLQGLSAWQRGSVRLTLVVDRLAAVWLLWEAAAILALGAQVATGRADVTVWAGGRQSGAESPLLQGAEVFSMKAFTGLYEAHPVVEGILLSSESPDLNVNLI